MNFIVENKESKVIIRCHVEKLDTLNAPELKSHFLHQSKQLFSHFIVDLSRVKYCDSSGLSALLVGNRLAKEKKSKMSIKKKCRGQSGDLSWGTKGPPKN